MIRKGDKVALIDEIVEGEVIKINGSEITLITSDGLEMKYDRTELVVIKNNQSEMSKYVDVKHGRLIREKENFKESKSSKNNKTKPKERHAPIEFDLHIENLVKNHKRMNNHDILTTQLDTARYKLEWAIRERIPRILFIHGVGEGVLQEELKYLLGRYPVDVSPGSYHKYGQGATEVYIRQNG